MKTKIDFKALDYADIEFDTKEPSIKDQNDFSDFLAKRKNSKAKTTQQLAVRV